LIRSALDSRLATLSSPPPIVYENVQYDPVVGTLFLDVALLPAQTEHPTVTGVVGQELALEQGIYQVTVVAPVNQGPGAAATKAEAVRALFPRGLSLTSGGVQVRVSGRPSVAPALVDADWYRVPVSVPYFAHVVG
jgi:hypothetical protein